MKFRFNPRQLVIDVIKFAVAIAFVSAGHPYAGVLLAMVHIEARA